MCPQCWHENLCEYIPMTEAACEALDIVKPYCIVNIELVFYVLFGPLVSPLNYISKEEGRLAENSNQTQKADTSLVWQKNVHRCDMCTVQQISQCFFLRKLWFTIKHFLQMCHLPPRLQQHLALCETSTYSELQTVQTETYEHNSIH